MTKSNSSLSTAVFAVLTSFALTQAAQAKDFFDYFPQNDSFKVSTGQKVPLPTHFYETEALWLIGSADHAGLQEIADAEGYTVPRLPGTSRGLLYFTFLLTRKHTIGPHQDLSIAMPIEAPKQFPGTRFDGPFALIKQELYGWRFWGDLLLSNLLDIEAWGLTKRWANFQVDRSKEDRLGIKITDREGTLLETDVELPCGLVKLPSTLESYISSPQGPRAGRAALYFQGKLAIKISHKSDVIRFNPHHSYGKILESLDFKPLLWQYGNDVHGAMVRPFANFPQ